MGTVKEIVKKVTLELIYDVVDERTKELKEEMKHLSDKIEDINKTLNSRIDQIHTRLDQMMHMLAEIIKERR